MKYGERVWSSAHLDPGYDQPKHNPGLAQITKCKNMPFKPVPQKQPLENHFQIE